MSMIEDDERRSDLLMDSSDQESADDEQRGSDFGSIIGLGKRKSPPELRRLLRLVVGEYTARLPSASVGFRRLPPAPSCFILLPVSPARL